MAAAGRLIKQLYKDFGQPLVDEVMSVLGRDADPEVIAKAVAQRAPPKPLALPAPPKQLALPAPGPGLPKFAAKPRGGQFWVDKDIVDGNNSPEAAARQGARAFAAQRFVPDEDYEAIQIGPRPGGMQTTETDAQKWLERALTKYYKNEFGSPDDPLRALAERGLHYDPDMTPEKWQATVNSYLLEDPVESILFPPNPKGGMRGAGSNLRGEAMVAMPWLAKLPVTDKVYGISSGGLDLEHFADEFANALKPERSGLPMDLAVRPESLNRMTFPQAVERVGKINQFRVKEMERATLSNLDSPAVQTFKEYPENNPMGLRWVELRAPKGTPAYKATDEMSDDDLLAALQAPDDPGERALRNALKYEGDTMGHCVGGYCDEVMAGQSRIFSLRDAKGEPHVTIETAPSWDVKSFADEYPGVPADELADLREEWLRINEVAPDDIVQIKGKQNRKPNAEYLPFVRDFVQSGNWGHIGDEENSGLRRLGGKLIPSEDYDKIIKDAYDWMRASPGGQAVRKFYKTEMGGYGTDAYVKGDKFINNTTVPVGNSAYSLNEVLSVLEDPDAWEPETIDSILQGVEYLKANPVELPPVFGEYAVGGRVSADRDFSRNPMSVKKARGGGMAVKKGR